MSAVGGFTGRLAGTPAVRREGRWLLTTRGRSVPADAALAADLDRLAAALAAADAAVAAGFPPPTPGVAR